MDEDQEQPRADAFAVSSDAGVTLLEVERLERVDAAGARAAGQQLQRDSAVAAWRAGAGPRPRFHFPGRPAEPGPRVQGAPGTGYRVRTDEQRSRRAEGGKRRQRSREAEEQRSRGAEKQRRREAEEERRRGGEEQGSRGAEEERRRRGEEERRRGGKEKRRRGGEEERRRGREK